MNARRNTIQRRLIWEAVRDLDTHASAEAVYAHVFASYPAISKATVYRNLNQMADEGELLNIGTLLGCARYDHNLHRHAHFICEACGRVVDVEDSFPGDEARFKELEGCVIKGHTLTLRGLCPQCKNL